MVDYFSAANIAFHDALDFFIFVFPGCLLLSVAIVTFSYLLKFLFRKFKSK